MAALPVPRPVPGRQHRAEDPFAAHQFRHQARPRILARVVHALARLHTDAGEHPESRGLGEPLVRVEHLLELVRLQLGGDHVARREEAFQDEAPDSLVAALGVPHPGRELPGLPQASPGEPVADDGLHRAQVEVAQVGALAVGPLLELGRAGGGEGGEEVSAVQLDGALEVLALARGQEGRAVGVNHRGEVEAAVRRDDGRVPERLTEHPQGVAEAVAGGVGGEVGPEQVGEALARRGLADRALEVREDAERLAGAQEQYACPVAGNTLQRRAAQGPQERDAVGRRVGRLVLRH